jgi:ATP-dependent Lon protease
MTDKAESTTSTTLPVLPLRDVVVYPAMVVPLFVGREKSMRALDRAMQGDRQILLVAQRSPDIDDPAADDLHDMGTRATVLQLLRLPDGTVKVLVEGQQRAKIGDLGEEDGVLMAQSVPVAERPGKTHREVDAAAKSLLAVFEQYAKINRKIAPELLASLAGIDDPSRFADTVASHLAVRIAEKQRVLETVAVGERLELLIGIVDGEIDVQQLEKRIRGRVKSQMEKSQREYYLNEQMKAIQKELGDLDEAPSEMDELERKIANAGMPKVVETKARAELNKLKQMPPMSAEATVVRNYVDWLVQVPWQARTEVRQDLGEAEQVLDADHYGLEEVKQRILEFLAVQQRVKQLKGPILCLVGPPGVGKTSLGQSIAKATGRKFIRMALGGVRDEAEIRGHRRTYIGSMPGRIIQNLVKVGSRNALVMLDEIDKMSMDFRGDPSAALLEVLDPEQNHTFNDHYLEVDFDLSEVMFVATSNSLNIPGPLLDRMELIRIPGYTEDEKVSIGQRYLLPKQMQNNGLRAGELAVSEPALRDIVRYYTRESGVRSLEREISKICRKVVKENTLADARAQAQATAAEAPVANERTRGRRRTRRRESEPELRPVSVDQESLVQYLGVRKHNFGLAEDRNEVGVVTGLAWTQVGGDLLSIEATVLPGKGKLIHTGQLGDVMQESIQAALSVVRARAATLGIDPEFHQKFDLHIHVPEGATPKDGPSAGIAMATALVSALTRVPVRADVAMTGEITLRGRVLPIGGLKEKLLAAHRGGIKLVLIPDENRKDLAEIPANVTGSLDIRPVRWVDEVLHLALAAEASTSEASQAEESLTTSVIAPAEETAQDSVNAGRAH